MLWETAAENLSLLALAGLLSAVFCLIAIGRLSSVRRPEPLVSLLRLVGAALAFVMAVWGAGYVALFALFGPSLVRFDLRWMLLAFAVAFLTSLLGFGLFLAAQRRPVMALLGGVILGGANLASVLAAVAALRLPGQIVLAMPVILPGSVAVVLLAASALVLTSRTDTVSNRLGGAALLWLSLVAAMIFIVAGMSVAPGPGLAASVAVLDLPVAAIAVAAGSLLTMLLIGVASGIEKILAAAETETRLRFIALHDPLTGLAGRSLLEERIGHALVRAEWDEKRFAVLCLGLDGLARATDIMGREARERLLVEAAERVRAAAGEVDTIARLGGGAFAVLTPPLDQAAAMALARQLLACLATPLDIGANQIDAGASVGVAIYPESGRSAADLLKNADAALYRAKRDGRGVFRVFEPAMDAELQARRRLERDLRQAIHGGGLQLHYQPLFDCQSGAVLGFEALLRWMHPEHGAIPPAEFVPMAEECGLIGPLGRFVLETACAEAVSWAKPYCIAVNLSPAQFRSHDLVETVAATLRRSGLRPERLELEITEGVLIDNAERALALLKQLKSLGIRIALDDFGTGYSSLSYLRLFPFDKLKIDRSFVQGLGEEGSEAGGSMAIISAILAMARSLRLDVTAEGVETVRQLELLRTQHCGQVQGFLLGRPTPANQLHPFLAEQAFEPADARVG